MSHQNTLHHITTQHITLHYITTHYITLHYTTLQHIKSHCNTLNHITLYRYITLHHITSHHITSHHITSHISQLDILILFPVCHDHCVYTSLSQVILPFYSLLSHYSSNNYSCPAFTYILLTYCSKYNGSRRLKIGFDVISSH